MRTAKLFIRGSKEPIEITEEQGIKANQIKRGEGEFAELTDKDTISIGDVWTGERGDLRYIKFEHIAEKAEERIYSSKEMFEFEEELQPYFIQEGDDEFEKWVNRFVEQILGTDEKLFWGEAIKNMILESRKVVNEITEDNEKKDKTIESAERIVKANVVGMLSRDGEERYLEEQKVIKRYDNGSYAVIQKLDGSVPYTETSYKLTKYKEWKSRREYASGKELESYDEMSGDLADNMTMNNDKEYGVEESF